MSQDRWQLLEELFHAALERPQSERQRFLEEACGGDTGMLAEVESLLSSDPETPAESSPIAERVRRAAVLVAFPPRQGDRIGQYRIVEEIGHGGMGLVYRATRADQEFHKQVAIKVAKTGMDTAIVLERFRRERQILASLDHRYVAKLLDGGTTDDGLPYFVMEYVEGQPIHRYARAKNLSVRERLVLFRGVLEAVAYAHQNLVVHLDLKPSNILIAADGTPKLLDFGISRLLESRHNEAGPALSTETGGAGDNAGPTSTPATTAFGRLMTPDYASPEQIRGQPLTTATDVYGLGAVLYQLLTGELPHQLEGLAPRQVERVICALDVVRPSERAPALRKELAGDLDNIVLKAMAKDSTRRYRSAQELEDELRRYLEGLPVRAVSGSRFYRVQKFLWRNRLATAATAAVFVSLLGGLVAASWEAHLTETQRRVAESEGRRAELNAAQAQRNATEAQANARRAEAETARAEQALKNAESSQQEAVAEKKLADQRSEDVRKLSTTYLFDFNDALENSPGTLPVRRHMVDLGIRFLDGLAKQAGNNVKLHEDVASAYMRLGDVLGNPDTSNLGDTKAALESYRKALAMVEALGPVAMERGEYLMAQMDLRRRMGEVLSVAGSTKDLLEEYALGVKAAREALQSHEGVLRFDEKAANILTGYSHALVTVGQDQVGLAAIKENYQVLTRMMEHHPGNVNFPTWLATDYANQGRALAHLGNLQGAVGAYRKEIDLLEEQDRKGPPDAPRTRMLMFAYSHLGDMLGNPQFSNLGDYAGAIAAYEKMSRIANSVASADRENASAQLDAAMSAGRLGGLLLARNDAAAALPALQESVAGLQRLVTRDPSNHSNALYFGSNLELLGDAQLALGQSQDAKASYSKDITTVAPLVSADAANLMYSATLLEGRLKLGLLLSQEGDPAALDLINQAIADVTRLRGVQPAESRLSLRLARCLGVRALAGYRLATRPGAVQRDATLRQARADVARAEELLAGVPPESRSKVPASGLAVIAEARKALADNP